MMKGRYGSLTSTLGGSASPLLTPDRASLSEDTTSPDPVLDVQFHFQIGFHREPIIARRSDLSLHALKELACQVLEKQV